MILGTHPRDTAPRTSMQGMTIIEVMVATVLSSILVVALMSTWAMVDEEFLLFTLKQKAIFVLNGEMERAVATFRYPITDAATAWDWFKPVSGTTRYVYNSQTTSASMQRILPGRNVDITTAIFADSQIDHVNTSNAAGTGQDCGGGKDCNVVWLDRARGITASLSFDFSTTVGATTAPNPDAHCRWVGDVLLPDGNGANCRLLVVYLKYPFRYRSATNPLGDLGPPKEIELQTIVGGLTQ